MNILVAGGAGYIGSALVPVLLDYGYNVTVIDLLWFGNTLPSKVNVIKKDLFDCKKGDFKEFDQIIFLAGLSNDPMADFDPAKNFIYNASLPSYLAYIAKQDKVKRFIYASTCSVYGYTTNKLFDENANISCNYPYGVSKLQGEKGVMHLQDENFSTICFRKGTISGYSPRMRFDLMVNTMTLCAKKNKNITVSNPSLWRPIISVKDVVAAYVRAIQSGLDVSGVFNLAYDNYTVGEVAYIVKTVIEEKEESPNSILLNIKDIPDARNYRVSINKAKEILGFHPTSAVSDIVLDLLKHWDGFGNLDNDNYYNIKICEKLFGPQNI